MLWIGLWSALGSAHEAPRDSTAYDCGQSRTLPAQQSQFPADSRLPRCAVKPIRQYEADTGQPQAALDAQFAALKNVQNLTALNYMPSGPVSMLIGDIGLPIKLPTDRRSVRDQAALIRQLKPLLLLTGSEVFELRYRDGNYVRLTQLISGRSVIGSSLAVQTDPRTGHLRALTASVVPDRGLTREPKLSGDEAREKALAAARPRLQDPRSTPDVPELGYAIHAQSGRGALAWRVRLEYCPLKFGVDVWVDATDGTIVTWEPLQVGIVAVEGCD